MEIANDVDSSRIQTLQEDLVYFRNMLKQTTAQSSGNNTCHVSILKLCNPTLDKKHRQMHSKYLELLNKTQIHEVETHLRILENELSMLLKAQAPEIAIRESKFA